MGRKSELPVAEREEAVLRLVRHEEPAAALARRYQVSEQTLYRWRDEFLEGGRQRLGKGQKKNGADEAQRRISKLERELAHRTRMIGELTIANDLLKKFSESPL